MLLVGVVLALVVNGRTGFGIAGGGLAGIVVAFGLMEYPRLALVFVGLGLIGLCGAVVLFLVRSTQRTRAIEVLVPAVEKLDTGPKSAGRRVKRALASDPAVAKVVRRGIEFAKRRLRGGDESGN